MALKHPTDASAPPMSSSSLSSSFASSFQNAAHKFWVKPSAYGAISSPNFSTIVSRGEHQILGFDFVHKFEKLIKKLGKNRGELGDVVRRFHERPERDDRVHLYRELGVGQGVHYGGEQGLKH